MKDLLKIKLNINTKKDLLKLELDQKEIVQYNAWKSLPDNEKSREALEKVVAKLKLEDENWLNQEEELVILKNKATIVNNIVDMAQSYLNQGLTFNEEEYIQEFSLGEFL